MIHFFNFIDTFRNIHRYILRNSWWIVLTCLVMIPQMLHAQGGITNQNHYKSWLIQGQPFQKRVLVKDQFMQDSLMLVMIELLSNPTLKVHESQPFPIINPDHHLTWYRALGRDTSINLAYKNQFESTAVTITNPEYLLVPAQKYPHPPPLNLDHYKAYRIKDAQTLHTPVMLQDQFDLRYGLPENIDSLKPTYFLTPAVKNMESPLHDSVTHYVAYQIYPPRMILPPPWEYLTQDQFGEHYLQVMGSMYLLVPSQKFIEQPTHPDTTKNHYKSWRLAPQPFNALVKVTDQIMTDNVTLIELDMLSNPAMKVHGRDTFKIKKASNHLTWYKAQGRDTLLTVKYVNQFESTGVAIGSTQYLLVPAQKLPHAPPESLDHYKAYQIVNPLTIVAKPSLRDQFDELTGTIESIDSLRQIYFLTPAMKNAEQVYDTVTHYVAYEIFPKKVFQYPVNVIDQFIPNIGGKEVLVLFSDILLVPTKKLSVGSPPDSLLGSVCGKKCNDFNSNGTCDQGEPPLANWTISLTSGSGGITSMMTNQQGSYCFSNLMPGQYTISETVQPGWQQTGPQPPGTYTVNLLVGQNITGLDFANIRTPDFDTVANHYLAWKTDALPYNRTVRVQDQFMTDSLTVTQIEFLANPVKKTRIQIISDIVEPDYHLTWYKAQGKDTLLRVNYINQFESTAVRIGSPAYLLLPTRKIPHSTPDSLDHYKAYRIIDPITINTVVRLEDQFDNLFGTPEYTDSIRPAFFLTPASKNMGQMYDTVTHYVAYEIFPKRVFQLGASTEDQFGPHVVNVQNSALLMVPTKKILVRPPYDTVSVSLNTGWNIVSVPLIVPDYRKTILFPSAISDAFAYEGVYVSKDTLENGVGYWLKYSSAGDGILNGDAITSLTITVTDGWNLIGSITDPVPTSSISSIPGGIITSQFFEYTTAYQASDTIWPGKGYWVKVNQAGQLILSETIAMASNRIRIVPTSEYPPPPPDRGEIEIKTLPIEYSLGQNYPNPFNPTTMIKFELPQDAIVKLTVYNTLGQTVKVLFDVQEFSAGLQEVKLDASDLPSGVYYYRLVANGKLGQNFVSVKKMLILK